jgi:hypothetical protein
MTSTPIKYDYGILPELSFKLKLEQELTISQLDTGMTELSRGQLEKRVKELATLHYIYKNQVADLLRHCHKLHMASMVPSNLGFIPEEDKRDTEPEPTEWKAKVQTE